MLNNKLEKKLLKILLVMVISNLIEFCIVIYKKKILLESFGKVYLYVLRFFFGCIV